MSLGPGILVSDLLSGDGPLGDVADDFTRRVCTICGLSPDANVVVISGIDHCRSCYQRSLPTHHQLQAA